MKNINRCTNERSVLLTCNLHKHILESFEKLPCESESNQDNKSQKKDLFSRSENTFSMLIVLMSTVSEWPSFKAYVY